MEKIQFKAGRIHFSLAVDAEGDIAGRHKFGNFVSFETETAQRVIFVSEERPFCAIRKNFA